MRLALAGLLVALGAAAWILLTPKEMLFDARVREVASQLRCPVCQGESIQDSPAELARDMRGVVRDMLMAGSTPEEVKAYFVERYGEWILLQPRPTGFNLTVYILPAVALLGGAILVLLLARKWTRVTPAGHAVIAGDDPDLDPW